MNIRNWRHPAYNSCNDKSTAPGFSLIFVLFFLHFLSLNGQAQTGVSYRFLEVVDTAGRPLAGATVEPNVGKPQTTNENGVVEQLPIYYGDYNTTSLKVSKPGYLPVEASDLLRLSSRDEHLLLGEHPQHDPRARIKIELLKAPVTAAERQALEVSQHKRELLWAAKQGNDVEVRRLLQTGVDANTSDVNGIPAILWAASSANVETIKALIVAGADVRSRDKPGRKALLYYLYYTASDRDDQALIRVLIKAGADLNAADYSGTTVMTLAKRSNDAAVIKLLANAGAKEK